jgi:protein-tyrosine-phosphatase/DNA-binding transcriptional ArsR family regulator
MEEAIPTRLAALGHPQRLAILRLLMRRFPDRLPAGDIAQALDLKPSTLSNYLSHLMQVGLVTQERIGTSLRYCPDMETLRGTFGFLWRDCCRGRPDLCPPFAPFPDSGAETMTHVPFKVLFICTGNSARSIFAETLLRTLGGGRFDATRPAPRPQSELNPFAVQVLKDKGMTSRFCAPRTWRSSRARTRPEFDFVFTVCDRPRTRNARPGPDSPSAGIGACPTRSRRKARIPSARWRSRTSYGALRNRIQAFVALPLESLDRMSLQKAVDDIGRWMTAGHPHDRLCRQRVGPHRQAGAEAAA